VKSISLKIDILLFSLFVRAEDATPIDGLIDRVYQRSDMIRVALDALRGYTTRYRRKEIRKEMRIAVADYKVVEGRAYYRGSVIRPR
jgi:hypothetical protein